MSYPIKQLIDRQREFQRAVGFPIDSITEADRNEMSEKYVFKLIEEAVELRKEFPSVVNPWSKKQKPADIQRVKEEFADVLMFALNIAIVWRFTPEEILQILVDVQNNNFMNIKKKKMDLLNSDIKKIPGRTHVLGTGSLQPKTVYVGIIDDPQIPDCYYTRTVKCVIDKEPSDEMVDFYEEILQKELDILALNNPDMKIVAYEN